MPGTKVSEETMRPKRIPIKELNVHLCRAFSVLYAFFVGMQCVLVALAEMNSSLRATVFPLHYRGLLLTACLLIVVSTTLIVAANLRRREKSYLGIILAVSLLEILRTRAASPHVFLIIGSVELALMAYGNVFLLGKGSPEGSEAPMRDVPRQ